MANQWGRKETVVWPPQVPIYTIGTMILAVPILMALLFGLYLTKPFLARNYTGDYLRSAAGAQFKLHNSFRLIFLEGGKRAPRVAQPADLVSGTMVLPGGKEVNVQLSPEAVAEGYTTFARGPEKKIADEPLYGWFRAAIFGGDDVLSAYGPAFVEAGIVVIFLFCFSVPFDFKRGKQMKYGRLLRGPVMSDPKQFNQILKGRGMGIPTDEKGVIVRLPLHAEAKHIQVMGDTGSGKSTLLRQMLSQIEDREETAIVYDPAGEFIQRFYREERGDVILNPLDARCCYWSPVSELQNAAEAQTIAVSLYQPPDEKPNEFFIKTPQKIFAHLMKYRPSVQDLIAWMSNPDEIDRRVEGTELAQFIGKDSPDQRNGVLGSLGIIADSFRLLPTKEQAKNREWSATGWAQKRKGWIFLTGTEAEQEALRPLHSLWIDLLILRLLTPPKKGQKRAWFVLDELASLQKLPQFHSALTKGRKSDNPIIFGYQGKAQLEVIYGHLAEVMLSQPATKFVLKTAEPKAAKWASELIGEIEIERVRETVSDGKRAGKSFTMDRQIEPLVMSSEIEGLDDLHCFLKLGNNVTRFSFPHMDRELIAPMLVSHEAPEDMWLELPKPAQEAKPASPPTAAHVPAQSAPVVAAPTTPVVIPQTAAIATSATLVTPEPVAASPTKAGVPYVTAVAPVLSEEPPAPVPPALGMPPYGPVDPPQTGPFTSAV